MHLANTLCERTALDARELLSGGVLTDKVMEDVRGCILLIAETRERVPNDRPGLNEAGLQRLIVTHQEAVVEQHAARVDEIMSEGPVPWES